MKIFGRLSAKVLTSYGGGTTVPHLEPKLLYSLRLPLLFGSGLAFGSAAFDADVSLDLDSEELLSDLLSDFESDDLDSVDFESVDFVSVDVDSDLLSVLDSDSFFDSEAADFL